MSILEICDWIQNTPSSTAIRESLWVFPIIEGSHVLALGLSVGTVLWFDLRLMGLAMRQHTVSEAFDYAQNQQPPAPVPSRIQKITDDYYVLLGEGGNTSVYVTDEGVILVDVKFERNFEDIQAKVKSITDKPIKYIFNTHAHGDHTG